MTHRGTAGGVESESRMGRRSRSTAGRGTSRGKWWIAVSAAWALTVGPLPASARAPSSAELATEATRRSEAGDLAGAAALHAEAARGPGELLERLVAAWKAINLWEEAFEGDGSATHLCAARSLALTMLGEPMAADFRRDFEGRLGRLEVRLAGVGGAQACEPAVEPAVVLTNDRTPTDRASPREQALAGPAETAGAPATRGRGFRIGGGVSLGAGIGLLGAMTYGIVVDAQAAVDVRYYSVKNESVGLTTEEAAEARAAFARGREASYLALGTGIAGGALVVTGAALLFYGRRLRRAAVDVVPTLSPTTAGIGISGRF